MPLAHDLRGDGPLLVLVHGITENRRSWDPLTDDLARDHRVLRVDLRGHGESPGGDDYGIAALVDDVAAVVAGADPGGRAPLLVGHSLGGMVVTAYAAAHEVRGAVNVDQSLDLAPLQGGIQAQADNLRGEAFPAVIAALFDSMRGPLPDAEWARLDALRRPDQAVVLGIWGLLLDTTPTELERAVDGMVAGLTAPYLALDGIDPGPGHAEWLARRIPQAQLEVWDGLGHYPHLVEPRRFLERLRAFEADLAEG
ncbi:alpha/beta fold hydrolase [Pseudonocardia sp. S2-4]|uniref:Alpha/beta fold hydrolase n=1 Tax=Pseudonocardia humida TaxID=2800819 RepID=A0ABT1A2V6_9PSEU|nr:alpha/beta fold hydrolase [Pseudonocardia humida]